MLRVNAINRQGLLKCLTFNPKSLVFKTVSVPCHLLVTFAIGDHEEAIENWEDAGFDLLAAAIPFVPDGTSKVINGAKSIEKTARGSTRQNVTKVFSSRKKALDARPKPHPIKPKQRRITHQTKNKKGEDKKFKTDKGSQTPHVHDDNHNNINKKNVHYRVGKKKIKKL